ncbi:10198_t:CDS:2, partial [Entrophospora sp. SA101]
MTDYAIRKICTRCNVTIGLYIGYDDNDNIKLAPPPTAFNLFSTSNHSSHKSLNTNYLDALASIEPHNTAIDALVDSPRPECVISAPIKIGIEK